MESNNMNEKMKRPYKAHVLVLPFPAQGHINPMLQFCKRLVAKGIKATLANTVAVSKTMMADPGSPVGFDTISDGFDESGFSTSVAPGAYLDRFRVVGSETLASLIRRLDDSGYPVDAVVYDGFLPWALDVAKEFGLVGAMFFTQTCAVNTIYYHVFKGFLTLPLSDSCVLVPGLPPLQPWETPSFVHIYGSYPDFYNMVINQFLNIDKADWVLFNSFYESEKEVVDLMKKLWKVRTIGPTLPSMYLDKRLEDDTDYGVNLYEPDSNACMTWLNSKPPSSVIYVSYGSFAEVQAEQMEEVAHCLKDIDYNFLWVVRPSKEAKLPAFINKTSEKGLVVTWSPQLEVLSSKSIGCFVTHCGLNSVLEALCLGVAIVAVPLWTDQTTNAKYVEDVWGVGVRARKDGKGIVRREMLGESIREVMRGERRDEIVKNLVKWKKLAREAIDEGGSSDKNIDEFVAALAGY